MYSIPIHDNRGKLTGAINFQYLNQVTDIFDKVDIKDLCDKGHESAVYFKFLLILIYERNV